MNNVTLMPAVVAQNNRAYDFSDAEEAVIIEDTPTEGSSVSFLEANTKRSLTLMNLPVHVSSQLGVIKN